MTTISPTFCSYFAPCSLQHAKANQKFKKLNNCEKTLIVLCTALAALASCFILGLAGAAVYRLLVYKWSKVSHRNVVIEDIARKTDTVRLVSRVQPQQLSYLEEIKINALKEAQESIISYYNMELEDSKCWNPVFYSQKYSGGIKVEGIKLHPQSDYPGDFMTLAFLKDEYLRKTHPAKNYIFLDQIIENQERLKKNEDCGDNPLQLNIRDLEKDSWIEGDVGDNNVDNNLLNECIEEGCRYFSALFKLDGSDEVLIPKKIKDLVTKLDDLAETIFKYNEDQFNDVLVPELKCFLKERGSCIRASIFRITYPLKIFLRQYEQKVLMKETLHTFTTLPKELIDLCGDYIQDFHLIREELNESYASRTKNSPFFKFRTEADF